MEESQRDPQLVKGMDAWYVMDPAFQRMVQLVGPKQAIDRLYEIPSMTSMASPASDVMTCEINRGTAAHMMANRGQFPLFREYGGMAEANRGPIFPRLSATLWPRLSQYIASGADGTISENRRP